MEKNTLNRPLDLAERRLGVSLGELMYPDRALALFTSYPLIPEMSKRKIEPWNRLTYGSEVVTAAVPSNLFGNAGRRWQSDSQYRTIISDCGRRSP